MFKNNEELIEMRKMYSQEFFETYKEAFDLYEIGDWPSAREKFEKVLTIRNDKPSKLILDFMAENNFNAIENW